LKRPRNLTAWKIAHQLGTLLSENLDDFSGLDAHRVLKRLQIETGIGCELMAIKNPEFGMVHVRIPLSMAFDSMEEGEFQEIYGGFCQHVIDQYWPELDQDQINNMVGLVGLG